ncbi:17120_t:CDS:2 [Acaulospora morrowiae]|uniref:17120_t:CDS:1 n=1 Tax=Acaulospora morrowiae TaxID=94023 RepID=A0A9N9AH03_9GLOM|nr:17120_t:CDS:2 [Acaulospora morrowiae]
MILVIQDYLRGNNIILSSTELIQLITYNAVNSAALWIEQIEVDLVNTYYLAPRRDRNITTSDIGVNQFNDNAGWKVWILIVTLITLFALVAFTIPSIIEKKRNKIYFFLLDPALFVLWLTEVFTNLIWAYRGVDLSPYGIKGAYIISTLFGWILFISFAPTTFLCWKIHSEDLDVRRESLPIKQEQSPIIQPPITQTSPMNNYQESMIQQPITQTSPMNNYQESMIQQPIIQTSPMNNYQESMIQQPITQTSPMNNNYQESMNNYQESMIQQPIIQPSPVNNYQESMIQQPEISQSSPVTHQESMIQQPIIPQYTEIQQDNVQQYS